MRYIRNAFVAMAAIGVGALTVSAANAQATSHGSWKHGSSYSYGADRANPSFAPYGYDQDNPPDQQLQGR
jgi:hypothetical protein